jgi:hypothetical protein
MEVELVRLDLEDVPRGLRLQVRFTKYAAKLRHIDLDGLPGRPGRGLTPERIDQAVGRDDSVRIQQEHCKQRALLAPGDRNDTRVVEHFEWAENSKLHAKPLD